MSSTPRRTAENASVMASSTRPFRCSTTSAASAPASASPGAVRRCNEIVRSVRSETLFTKRQFLPLGADRQVELELLLDDGIGAALKRDGLGRARRCSVYSRAMLPTAVSVPW